MGRNCGHYWWSGERFGCRVRRLHASVSRSRNSWLRSRRRLMGDGSWKLWNNRGLSHVRPMKRYPRKNSTGSVRSAPTRQCGCCGTSGPRSGSGSTCRSVRHLVGKTCWPTAWTARCAHASPPADLLLAVADPLRDQQFLRRLPDGIKTTLDDAAPHGEILAFQEVSSYNGKRFSTGDRLRHGHGGQM
jgi:hypothetical protein